MQLIPPKIHPHIVPRMQSPLQDRCAGPQAAALYTIRAHHPAADNDTSDAERSTWKYMCVRYYELRMSRDSAESEKCVFERII